MYWQKRFDRENPDIELEEKIHEIHKRNKDYGYRRMCGELRNQGHIVNKKKVQRIMQKYNLQVMSFTRKSRKYSSYKGRIGTVAPNRIKRRFNTHIPHQKITTDTTEFKYYEVDSKGKMTMHKLYLDPFMDMFNGEIISYGIDKRPSAANVMNALNEAIEVTSDCPFRRTFHSDQGKLIHIDLEKRKYFKACHEKVIALIIQSWKISLVCLNKKYTMELFITVMKN